MAIERELYCKHTYKLIYQLSQVSDTYAKYQCKICQKILESEKDLSKEE